MSKPKLLYPIRTEKSNVILYSSLWATWLTATTRSFSPKTATKKQTSRKALKTASWKTSKTSWSISNKMFLRIRKRRLWMNELQGIFKYLENLYSLSILNSMKIESMMNECNKLVPVSIVLTRLKPPKESSTWSLTFQKSSQWCSKKLPKMVSQMGPTCFSRAACSPFYNFRSMSLRKISLISLKAILPTLGILDRKHGLMVKMNITSQHLRVQSNLFKTWMKPTNKT